jgi:N-acetylmuramic acid 6-phosphate etherase
MSETSDKRSGDFLKISDQFQLGALTTEASHPATANLSETARHDIGEALSLLFDVDRDVIEKYREFVESDRPHRITETLVRSLNAGGRIFFTGCGSTGRLSILLVSIWRDFWQRQRACSGPWSRLADQFEERAFSAMAGGDFALIKSVEGFEDFAAFGTKQMEDLGVSDKDVVFAITEGGETSFVIGTAWKALEAGAKVYFVYNNPDDVLCAHVKRSREIIKEPRIEKINLTTGPMAITGSTRMQATTIQLCVLVTVLEMAVRELVGNPSSDPTAVPTAFLEALIEMHSTLISRLILSQLAHLVALEESVYRPARKNNYFADRLAIDVLTDTTERSPTFCTPPFRKADDTKASDSWSFLFLPCSETPQAWQHILKRAPQCVEWSQSEVRQLVTEDKEPRTNEIVRKISANELMRFKIGMDGLKHRPLSNNDSAVAIISDEETEELFSPDSLFRNQLESAHRAGASIGIIAFVRPATLDRTRDFIEQWNPECITALVPLPGTSFLLDGVARAGVKMLLNALSTCTMVRLGRVMGNYMIWVVPSNLKLIDRSTRYIQKLTGLDYSAANHLLLEVIEYVEPRMTSDQSYPPPVGMAVMRARYGIGNEEAEQKLRTELAQ